MMKRCRRKKSQPAPELVLKAAVVLAVLLTSPPAAAFCQKTTCDPKVEACQRDADECVAGGLPLFWPGGHLAISVSSQGSPPDGITGEEAEQIAREAASAWPSVTCADGLHPGLRVEVLGQVEGAVSDRIDHVNLITFEDSIWEDSPEAVATTTVTFDATTGRITDSDIRVNSAQYCIVDTGTEISSAACSPLAGGDVIHPIDLLGVLTHEIGHDLGLDHTLVSGATMQGAPLNFQFQDFRSLESDDQAGICSIYPPSFAEDVAGGGWSCRASASHGSKGDANYWALAAVVMGACVRRRCTASRAVLI